MVINKGYEGRYLVKILKVPKKLKNIGIHPQALIRHFQPIINHKTQKKKTIRITNNPKKVEHLKKLGINVTKRIPIKINPNKYNENYLSTKSKKSGHIL